MVTIDLLYCEGELIKIQKHVKSSKVPLAVTQDTNRSFYFWILLYITISKYLPSI